MLATFQSTSHLKPSVDAMSNGKAHACDEDETEDEDAQTNLAQDEDRELKNLHSCSVSIGKHVFAVMTL